MASRNVVAKLSWDGVKKFTGDIKKTGREIDRSFEKGKRKVKQFETQGKKTSQNLKGSFAGLGKMLGPLGIGLGLTGAVLGMKRLITNTIEFRDEIAKASKATGIAVEFMSAMGFAAERSGSDFGSFKVGMRGLIRNMQGVQDNSLESVRAFEKLGIQVTDETGRLRKAEDVFLDVADAIKKSSNETEAAALAQTVFGRSGITLVPLLKEGRVGIEKLQKEAEKLGKTFTKLEAEEAEAAADAITNFNTALSGLTDHLVESGLPTLTRFLELMTSIATFDFKDAFAIDELKELQAIQELPMVGEAQNLAIELRKSEIIAKRLNKGGLGPFQQFAIALAKSKEEAKKLNQELAAQEEISALIADNRKILADELTSAQEAVLARGPQELVMLQAKAAIEGDIVRKKQQQRLETVEGLSEERALIEFKAAQAIQQDEINSKIAMTVALSRSIGDALFDAVLEGKKLVSVLKQIVKQLAKKVFGALLGAVVGSIFGGPLGASFGSRFVSGLGFQHGGRPPVGVPSLVGEGGPELFIPDRPGRIVPNNQVNNFKPNISLTINTTKVVDRYFIETEIGPVLNRLVRQGSLQLTASSLRNA